MEIDIDPRAWGAHAREMTLMAELVGQIGAEHLRVEDRRRSLFDGGRHTTLFEDAVESAFPTYRTWHAESEEDPRSPMDSVFTLTVLDGVFAYQTGTPTWSVAASSVVAGTPQASVVAFPELGRWYAASTERAGAYRDGELIVPGPASGLVAGTGRPETPPTLADPMVVLDTDHPGPARVGYRVDVLSTLYRGCLVIDGRLDAMLDDTNEGWRLAPLVPLAAGLGYVMTDDRGRQQWYDRRTTGAILARTEELHAVLVAMQQAAR